MKILFAGSQPANFAALFALYSQVANCAQIPLLNEAHTEIGQDGQSRLLKPEGKRTLHGRFLHVTDFHPDQFYQTYSATGADNACHRGSGPAGYYGAETSDCDSPVSLINATFDWIEKEVRDSVDFVLWTGDSARHDNDEKIPRSKSQVVGLNTLVAQKFEEVFGNRDEDDPFNSLAVPVVPTFGNNDILPHNIFDLGPNRWTKTYLDVWRTFIPEEQRHQFDQGGWFSVEVIPNKLAVFSLNSLYFFDNNAAVDGCSLKSEPGYGQFEWLRIQLQFIRDRGMKAMIIGHVPPARTVSKQSWDESCWQKYTFWMRQYRDVIAGSFFGHMNMDHFLVHDFDDIKADLDKGYGIDSVEGQDAGNDFNVQSAASYFTEMRNYWASLPSKGSGKISHALAEGGTMIAMSDDARPDWEIDALVKKGKKDGKKKDPSKGGKSYIDQIGGPFAERFSVSHVAPSVVPNYFPTIRIYEYNITGLDGRVVGRDASDMWTLPDSEGDIEAEKKKKKKKKDKQRKKRKFNKPSPPSKSAPPGPAYSPQSLTLLGFTQYYANLTEINNDFLSLDAEDLDRTSTSGARIDVQKWKEGKHKRHNGKKPESDSKPHPKKFHYEVLYDTRDDKVYKLKDLTVRSYLELAQRMGKKPKSSVVPQDEGELSLSDIVDPCEIDQSLCKQLSSSGEADDSVDAFKKGKKDKDKKKHDKKPKINLAWYTFIKRAFVGTMDPDDIVDQFGP